MTPQESERAAIIMLITRYGDECNRIIAKSKEGPLRTSLMGEFSACHALRRAILRGDHLSPNIKEE